MGGGEAPERALSSLAGSLAACLGRWSDARGGAARALAAAGSVAERERALAELAQLAAHGHRTGPGGHEEGAEHYTRQQALHVEGSHDLLRALRERLREMEAVQRSAARLLSQCTARSREMGGGPAGGKKKKGCQAGPITMATLAAQLAALAAEAEASLGRECALASSLVAAAADAAALEGDDGAVEALGALLAAQPNTERGLETSLELRLDGLREMLDWAGKNSRA